MLVNKVRIRQIIDLIRRAKTDKLAEFHAEEYAKELRAMQEENFKNVVALCKEYNIRYIHLGFTEICGCEGKDDNNRGWKSPAIWAISKRLGINGGCGNSDQYQSDMGPWFPYEAFAYWDIQEMRILSTEEVSSLDFRNVCENTWDQRRYTAPLSYGFELVTLDTLKAMDEKYAIT